MNTILVLDPASLGSVQFQKGKSVIRVREVSMEGGEYLETMRKEDWEQRGKNQDHENDNTVPLLQYWFQAQNDL